MPAQAGRQRLPYMCMHMCINMHMYMTCNMYLDSTKFSTVPDADGFDGSKGHQRFIGLCPERSKVTMTLSTHHAHTMHLNLTLPLHNPNPKPEP